MTTNTNIINNQSSTSPLTTVDATIIEINSTATTPEATKTIKPEKTGSTCCGSCDSQNSTS